MKTARLIVLLMLAACAAAEESLDGGETSPDASLQSPADAGDSTSSDADAGLDVDAGTTLPDADSTTPPDAGAAVQQSCESDADCTGACDARAQGCTCGWVRAGEKRCFPACVTSSDCFRDAAGTPTTCAIDGTCRAP